MVSQNLAAQARFRQNRLTALAGPIWNNGNGINQPWTHTVEFNTINWQAMKCPVLFYFVNVQTQYSNVMSKIQEIIRLANKKSYALCSVCGGVGHGPNNGDCPLYKSLHNGLDAEGRQLLNLYVHSMNHTRSHVGVMNNDDPNGSMLHGW